MAILPQSHHHCLKPIHRAPPTCRHPLPQARVYCAATTTTKPRPNQGKLVIKPRKSTINTTNDAPLLNDPSLLKSTWSHRAWVASGCATVLISLANSVAGSVDLHIWLEPVLAGYVGYLFADLGSGVYHWGIDNYGDASTPVFGSQIDAFQGHHKWPWTITKRQFANNLHALARVITFSVLPMDLGWHDQPVLLGFVGVASGCIMFSQQFHAWAHGTKSKLHPVVVALQDAGVLVSRSQHADHHRPPYNNNYCIVSGIWNEFLDKYKVFEALEMVLFFQLGLRPRSWDEPNSDWTEETEILPPIALP